jgi:hypothetical protein
MNVYLAELLLDLYRHGVMSVGVSCFAEGELHVFLPTIMGTIPFRCNYTAKHVITNMKPGECAIAELFLSEDKDYCLNKITLSA